MAYWRGRLQSDGTAGSLQFILWWINQQFLTWSCVNLLPCVAYNHANQLHSKQDWVKLTAFSDLFTIMVVIISPLQHLPVKFSFTCWSFNRSNMKYISSWSIPSLVIIILSFPWLVSWHSYMLSIMFYSVIIMHINLRCFFFLSLRLFDWENSSRFGVIWTTIRLVDF